MQINIHLILCCHVGLVKRRNTQKCHSCIFQPFLLLHPLSLLGSVLLESIPAGILQRWGCTLNKSPAHWRATLKDRQPFTHPQTIQSFIKCMFLDCGKNPEWREPRPTQGGTPTQKGPRSRDQTHQPLAVKGQC